jgi:hypothetical protein
MSHSRGARQRRCFWNKAKVPLQGNPASDRILHGPDCNRHSRVCTDALRSIYRATPAVHSDGHRDAFSEAWRNLSVRCGLNQKQILGTGPAASRRSAPRPGKERVGRTTLFSSSAMSSGRLFLDRVGRHQSPSPLHRRDQNKLIVRTKGRIYHQAVSSVLTGCLTFRDKRRPTYEYRRR